MPIANWRLPIDGLSSGECRSADCRLTILSAIQSKSVQLPINRRSPNRPFNRAIGNPSIGDRQSPIRRSPIANRQPAGGQ